MSWPVSAEIRADIDRMIAELNRTASRPVYGRSLVELFRKVVLALKRTTRVVQKDDLVYQPLVTLLEAVRDSLDAADAYEATLPGTGCPPSTVPGPFLAHSTITDEHHSDGELNFDITQSYEGSESDPVGAAKIEVQIATTDLNGDLQWPTLGANSIWFITIGDPATQHQNQINDTADRHWQMRCRFVDASDAPLSDWVYSDLRFIKDYVP